MNSLKLLELEYDGINGTITSYTSDPSVINYSTKLKTGIITRDYEIVKYSIDKIIEWYDLNIIAIRQSKFLDFYKREEHEKLYVLLEEIFENLNPEDFKDLVSTNNETNHTGKLIFLSHKSNDKEYANALRDFIIGLGVKDNQLIYTSHPLHKIPMDANIYDYLRSNINSEIFMIILWSNDYLESPACLNEMGAAWVMQSDYTNIYVPTFSFGNPKYHECAVDTRKMGAVLNGDQHCKANLIELKNKIIALFNLEDDEKKTSYLIDQFMDKLKSLQ